MQNTEMKPAETYWLITFGYRGGDFRANAVHRGTLVGWIKDQPRDVVLIFAVSITESEYHYYS